MLSRRDAGSVEKHVEAAMRTAKVHALCVLLSIWGPVIGLFAQPVWEKSHQFYYPTHFFSVFFLKDGRTGWAVGRDGFVIHTENAGATWVQQDSKTRQWLREVVFLDRSRGIAVGDSGTILRTEDGGQTWSKQSVASGIRLESAVFASQNSGWVVGEWGAILRTVDGGRSWDRQVSGTESDLYSVFFVDEDRGWVVGDNGVVLRTVDSGVHWSRQASGTENWLRSVFFADSLTGWAVGQAGVILHTSDGGRTWGRQSSGTSEWLKRVFFVSRTTGWAIGDGGTILYTADGGVTWVHQVSGTNKRLEGAFFVDSSTGWVVGFDGTVRFTNDGGETWKWELGEGEMRLEDVFFAGSRSGWVVGEWGAILRTVDGGRSWDRQVSGTESDLYSVFFVDEDRGWVVGDNGVVLRTVDSGVHWSRQASGTENWLRSVFFADSLTGWAVGQAGVILHTSDGGRTWGRQSSGTSEWLKRVFFVSRTTGWAIGDGGTILYTADGGVTWVHQVSGTNKRLEGAFFVDSSTGWVVGFDGTVLHTSDGGGTWQPQTVSTTSNLYAVFFLDSSYGWAIGDHGCFTWTLDGGKTWQLWQNSYFDDNLRGVCFARSGHGWAVGWNGTVAEHRIGTGSGRRRFFDDFSWGLWAWEQHPSGAWMTTDGELHGYYPLSASYGTSPQADLLLRDEYQIADDWVASVDFKCTADDSDRDYSSAWASFVLWEDSTRKFKITMGGGGRNWSASQESLSVVIQLWDKGWLSPATVNVTLPTRWDVDRWHRGSLEKHSDTYLLYLDSTLVLEYRDSFLNGEGKLGLQCYGTRRYDNFELIPTEVLGSRVLYLKKGDPTSWLVPGSPGSQAKELSRWSIQGYKVVVGNIQSLRVTPELIAPFQAVRLNGYMGGTRPLSDREGVSLRQWVEAGGYLLAEAPFSNWVPALSHFGVKAIYGNNGGSTGLDWAFHGAPLLIGPVGGFAPPVDRIAVECMDKPVLEENSVLRVAATESGYPAIVFAEAGQGKVVITFATGWSHDATYPGNAYRANITQSGNMQFLDNVIQWFESATGTHVSSPISGRVVPHQLTVSECYPNPFNPSTSVRYNVPQETDLRISIYDLRGRTLRVLYDGVCSAGEHVIMWDGRDRLGTSVPSGVYLLEIRSTSGRKLKKLVKLQ